jgi:very-short-patch-repair endonuclease
VRGETLHPCRQRAPERARRGTFCVPETQNVPRERIEAREWNVLGPDHEVASIARRQHGVVTSGQLAAAGLSPTAIRHRVRQGRLTRLHKGVYLASSLPAQFTPEMAAVLACGHHAALSHHAAAALWRFRPKRDGAIDVTVRRGKARPRPGIAVHRSGDLPVTRHHGISITTPLRTLLDLAPLLTQPELDRAVEEAQVRGLVKVEALASAPHRALRLTAREDASLTRSEAEQRLLALVRAADLPPPRTNVRVEGFEVDMAWPDQRLIVEVDGFAFHSTRAAFERDRLRDQALQAAGWRVMRITWRQIADTPEAVVARLAGALAFSPRPARRRSSARARTAALGRR